MPELERLYHLSPRVMGAGFPEDIDPNSALDPANWSIIGQDAHEAPPHWIMPAYPEDYTGDMLPEVEIGVHALPEDLIRIWGAELINLSSAFHSAVWSPRDDVQVDINLDSPATFSGVDVYLRRLSDSQDFYLGEIGASGTGRNRFSGNFDLGESQAFSDLLNLSDPEAPPEQAFDLYGAPFFGSGVNKVTTPSRKAGEGTASRYSYLESHWADGADAPDDPKRKYFGAYKLWLNDGKTDWENKYNENIGRNALSEDGNRGVSAVVLKALLATESGLNHDQNPNLGQLGKRAFFEGYNRMVNPENQYEHWYDVADEDQRDVDKNIRAAAGYLEKHYSIASDHVPAGTSQEEKYKLAVMGYHLGTPDFEDVISRVEENGKELSYSSAKEAMRELADEEKLGPKGTSKDKANDIADDVEQQVARIFDEERDPKESEETGDDVYPDGMVEFEKGKAVVEGPQPEEEPSQNA